MPTEALRGGRGCLRLRTVYTAFKPKTRVRATGAHAGGKRKHYATEAEVAGGVEGRALVGVVLLLLLLFWYRETRRWFYTGVSGTIISAAGAIRSSGSTQKCGNLQGPTDQH